MNIDEYQKQALSTVLPSANNLPYLTLGLNGEAGEVANKIKKWIRDGNLEVEKLDKKSITAELGDVLWYVAVISKLLGYEMSEVAQQNVDKLASRQRRSVIKGSGDTR